MAETLDAARAEGRLALSWAERFVESLALHGVRDACVCSGSRSAPLALALHRSGIRTHVPLDERAGAFFALGLARASRRPVAIVTTSGTGAANVFPAVIEASYGRVPLVVLTADRPPELRDTGAGQTIDQVKLFGSAVRLFHEVGAPSPEPELLPYVASLAARAVDAAWGPPAGPVHLNFAFREPLLPEPDALAPAPRRAVPDEDLGARAARAAHPSPRSIARAAGLLRARRRGLVLCGPSDEPPAFADAVAKLAAVTGYPVFADPASQVRYGPHDRARVCGSYDAFLRSDAFASREAPEVLIQFGAALTSKTFHLYASRHPAAVHLLVDEAPGWRDPSRRARELFTGDPTAFAGLLADALARGADPLPGWGEAFARAELAARRALERGHGSGADALTEGGTMAALLDAAPDGTLLYVGNSMSIRDLDLFGPSSEKRVRVLANRGANGIDGIVSSGLGAAAGSDAPTLVVTGDLSLHHDLNGLVALRDGGCRATIVVVNNDGGGIFSFLPVAKHDEPFERYFGTPHGLDFRHAADLYGVPFVRPGSLPELREEAARSLNLRESVLIEVRTGRAENVADHRSAWAEVIRAVEEAT
ncbi:MAG TPA: 2-succinyl-5-enolpyruvyl-6-hydroxy-3-cyclohexene-1-carboxylic-acid synthase [Candidatus Eisenbacteria bacterium]|nr:2-succinyl-5-enolpyruvyl-6-hydroxy-3-cyclohexene-1-carboxylic-acid synthase [Candidatus Eisenbacteria bacterium]